MIEEFGFLLKKVILEIQKIYQKMKEIIILSDDTQLLETLFREILPQEQLKKDVMRVMVLARPKWLFI